MNLFQRIKLRLSVEWYVLRPHLAKYKELLKGTLIAALILVIAVFFNPIGSLKKTVRDAFAPDNNYRKYYKQIKIDNPAHNGAKKEILHVPELPVIEYNERKGEPIQEFSTAIEHSNNASSNPTTIFMPLDSSNMSLSILKLKNEINTTIKKASLKQPNRSGNSK